MAGVVDTNILLYAANEDAPEHGRARSFLLEIGRSRDAWYLTDGIVYEFLRVATHPKVFTNPLGWERAVAFVRPLLDEEGVHVLTAGDEHWRTLETVLTPLTHPAGNLFFDVRTVVLMREHGIRRIYTTDTDFLQFADVDVVNPLRV